MRKRVCLLILSIALTLAGPLYAQIKPPPGSSIYSDLTSPLFLAGGLSTVSELSPAGDIQNPAASGGKQRFTADLSYLSLVGTGDESGWGHVVNAGVTIPTRAGVISGSGHFVYTPSTFTSLQLDTVVGLNVSFAKDLFPKLLVGAGLGALFGRDWGLGLDLGFVHLPGDVGFMKDFRWGVAMQGMGKGFAPVTGYTSYPETFTLATGAEFTLLDSKPLTWSFSGNLAFPSFQNVRLALGTELEILDFISLYVSSSLDLRELINSSARTVPVAFGATIKFAPSIRKNRSELNTTVAAAPLQNGIWAFGGGVNIPFGVIDRKAPTISIDTTQEYISPNLDGVLDDLTRSIGITDERFIKGYRFLVYDSDGKQVREIVNKDERPENVSVKNIFDRLVYVNKGISIPEDLRWDGRSGQGSVVSDGIYQYHLESWDDNGNLGRSETGTVVVDNTPPSIEISTPYLVFSPNEDGNKDTLPITQKGSEEDFWQAFLTNVEGTEVAQFVWENNEPKSFDWDGKNRDEILSSDGVYTYRITSTDRAGNTYGAQIDNIIINTQATPVNISINESYFSPNSDGAKDTLNFQLEIPVRSNIERWQLLVTTLEGMMVRTFEGTQTIPETILFDGNNNDGAVLEEGGYLGQLNVLYVNGNNPKAVSPQFTVDLTPPAASLSADLSIFSPNGDGNKDVVTIYQEASEEILWSGIIEDLDGQPLRTLTWRGRADAKIQWTGHLEGGLLAEDGMYFYQLRATDRAGNIGTSKKIRIELDTEETEVFLSVDALQFSPNADGVKDRITISPKIKVSTGIEQFELRIVDSSGEVIRTVMGQNRAPEDFSWDGLDNRGRRVTDGSYSAQLELNYHKGDEHEVGTSEFVVDTQSPTVQVSAEYALFSPDGDGSLDLLPLKQDSSAEDLWEGEFLDSGGAVIRSLFWKETAPDFNWDGKDENGNKIPDGSYIYRVRSTDRAGNSVMAELKGIEIDTRLTPLFLTVSSNGFSPNRDGIRDEIEFSTYVGLTEGIKSWELSLSHSKTGVQKSFSGVSPVPTRLRWDGRKEQGMAAEGNYQANFTVEYFKGNRPQVQSRPFTMDISPPEVALSIAPEFFSPDNDGIDDELTIGIKVRDLSRILEWTMEIRDPKDRLFYSAGGKGLPTDRIIWDGLSNWGELVQAAEDYTLKFRIQDNLGNTRRLEKNIPVDVLVIRDGDKLKIRISSITFPPNSPDLAAVDDAVKVAKNDKTLARLAVILSKYSSYKFRIEGHANNLSWQDPAKAAKEEKEELGPLSLSRAEAVKIALIVLGLDPGRISVAGLGGTSPIVPFSDTENRWKNRRVEFILLKK